MHFLPPNQQRQSTEGTTQVSRYQKCKTNLDFTEARDSEWQWHQMGHMQVCTSLQTDNHASTPPLSFFTGRVPFPPPNQQRQSTEGITAKTNKNEAKQRDNRETTQTRSCLSDGLIFSTIDQNHFLNRCTLSPPSPATNGHSLIRT